MSPWAYVLLPVMSAALQAISIVLRSQQRRWQDAMARQELQDAAHNAALEQRMVEIGLLQEEQAVAKQLYADVMKARHGPASAELTEADVERFGPARKVDPAEPITPLSIRGMTRDEYQRARSALQDYERRRKKKYAKSLPDAQEVTEPPVVRRAVIEKIEGDWRYVRVDDQVGVMTRTADGGWRQIWSYKAYQPDGWA